MKKIKENIENLSEIVIGIVMVEYALTLIDDATSDPIIANHIEIVDKLNFKLQQYLDKNRKDISLMIDSFSKSITLQLKKIGV
jgi:hypothetical protein